MRNSLILLLAGSILCGCLGDEETGIVRNNSDPVGPSGNSSPTISGNPQSAILIGDTYVFAPNASDPNGDSLTFQITNLPGWASFNTSTGRLTGQPTLGNVGTYSNIGISVSDGSASRSLPTFSITVSQVALGNVTLSWTAPTENTDGSALTDLAGYKIHYGKSSGNYDNEILINTAGTTTYFVDNLVPDTYFFAATSFNTSGVESSFSGEAVRSVN